MAGVEENKSKRNKRGCRGSRILTKRERETLINLFKPLKLQMCTKDELNMNAFMKAGHEVRLSPSLIYHCRAGEITVRGRWYWRKIAWAFELICLGKDIIWQSSTYRTIGEGEVTTRPLLKVQIQILLKYFEKLKQEVTSSNFSDYFD